MAMPTILTYVGNPSDYKKEGVKLHDQKAAAGQIQVGVLVDCSGSTEDVNEDIQHELHRMVDAMQRNVILKGVVQLLVMTYNHNCGEPLVNKPLEKVTQADIRLPKPAGATDTGAAVARMLQLMDQQKAAWRESGVPYFQPIMFLFTDGFPSAGNIAGEPASDRKARQNSVESNYRAAASSIQTRLGERKLLFAAGGFQRENGVSADMDKLSELTGGKYVYRIVNGGTGAGSDGINLDDFFNALVTMTCSTVQGSSIDTLDDLMLGEVFSRGKKQTGGK